jgi:hypothetical protein
MARLTTLYVLNLLICLPVLIFQLAAPELLRSRLNHMPGGALLGAMILLLLTFFLTVVGTAAIHHVLAQESGPRVGLWAGTMFIGKNLYKLSGTASRYALTVVAGFILFIPGLIFMTWYALTPQTIAAEDLTGKQAMDRSKELTSGVRYSIFIILMICLTATATISGLMAGLAEFFQVIHSGSPTFSDAAGGHAQRFVLDYPGYALITTLTYLFNTLVLTFQAVCLTQVYFDVRNGREIFNPLRNAASSEILASSQEI